MRDPLSRCRPGPTAAMRSGPWLAVLSLCFGAAVLGGPVRAGAACHSDNPTGILDCLKSAYADRDSAEYVEMLTDDFRLYNYGPDSTFWDRPVAVDAASKLFKRTSALRLDILDGWKVVAGAEPGTWVIDSLAAKVTLTSAAAPDAKPIEMLSDGNQLYLRHLPGDPPRLMRPGGGVPRQRLGHRQRERCAPQDVHRHHG